MVMSDRIILMNGGRIVQQGSPRELYERPICRFAAEFVGSANLLEGVVVAEHASAYRTIRLPDGLELRGRAAWAERHPAPDGNVLLCIRPENIQVVPSGSAGDNVLSTRVTRVSYFGAALNCDLALGATVLRVDLPARSGLSAGAEITVRVDPNDVTIVPTD
jgi:ABC-type sugar transport system ATPase subunit